MVQVDVIFESAQGLIKPLDEITIPMLVMSFTHNTVRHLLWVFNTLLLLGQEY